jgi:hypothetical protein
MYLSTNPVKQPRSHGAAVFSPPQASNEQRDNVNRKRHLKSFIIVQDLPYFSPPVTIIYENGVGDIQE